LPRTAPLPWVARPNRQEQFSDAFLLAIAAAAGCASSRPVPDNDSIDWTLSCRLPRRPKLDIQLKSTIYPGGDDEIRYRLKAKNYDDLILSDLIAPRILVLVTVPRNVEDWLCLKPDAVLLRYCAYWKSLAGGLRTSNNKSFTVPISRKNVLTPEALRDMMVRINNGEPL